MTVELTSAAAARVATLAENEGKPKLMLRVGVLGGGCSGFQYEIGFAEEIGKDDQVFETDGIKMLIDETSLPFLTGAKVDFVQELIGASFRIDNPNANASCGCGSSFSLL
ncbi:MAG: iron-sulfur cluster insertion protein ErpA [Alphaproteobacteria bacterium]